MEYIELIRRPALSGPVIDNFGHNFLVYYSNNGTYVFSGFPENPFTGQLPYDAGRLLVEHGAFTADSFDWAYRNVPGTTIASGGNLSTLWSEIDAVGTSIDSNNWQYNFVLQNSNSAVAAAAKIAGFSVPNSLWDDIWSPGIINDLGFTSDPNLAGFDFPQCFPSGVLISRPDETVVPIETIVSGDTVSAFDGATFHGRRALVPKRVTRLFTNITDTWISLSNGLLVTPGHHFLDAFGTFRTTAIAWI